MADEKPTPEKVTADNDIREVMRTASGRRFVASVLNMTGLRADVFNENPTTHAYYEGRRSIGVQIESDLIGVDAMAYAAMIIESLQNFAANRKEPIKTEENQS